MMPQGCPVPRATKPLTSGLARRLRAGTASRAGSASRGTGERHLAGVRPSLELALSR